MTALVAPVPETICRFTPLTVIVGLPPTPAAENDRYGRIAFSVAWSAALAGSATFVVPDAHVPAAPPETTAAPAVPGTHSTTAVVAAWASPAGESTAAT